MSTSRDDIENRLTRDAAAFEAECARLDHDGALARTLAYLESQGMLPPAASPSPGGDRPHRR